MYRLAAINGKQALSNSAIATFAVVLNALRRSMDSYSLTHLEAFPYPWWNAMVGSKVGYFLPVKADYYCWTNLYP